VGCGRRKVGEKYANYNEKLDTLHAKQQQEHKWGSDFPKWFPVPGSGCSVLSAQFSASKPIQICGGRLSGPNEALALPAHFN